MYASYENYNLDNKKEEEKVDRLSYDLIDITSFEKAKKLYEMIIVYAWANWCNPCKAFAPKYESLGHLFKNLLKTRQLLLLKDEIDREDCIHRDQCSVIPTFFIYINGDLKEVFSGVDSKKIQDYINNYFQKDDRVFKL